ncbi:MAG: DUF1934 domain-containing protein [Oscillospiraceae bacterium]|nr:DUF1934 domain-containing protein [Oscillospiraceae bacterium]
MPQQGKRDVIISIRGCRFSPDPNDSSLVDVVTDGSMVSHPHGYTVFFCEPFDGDGDARTTLLVEDGRVTMLRSGARNTQMVFEEGRRHVSYYDTEDGPVTVGVTASRVAAELGGEGGRIEVVYGLEIAGGIAEESHVSIDIHAASGPWAAVPEGITVYRDTFIN